MFRAFFVIFRKFHLELARQLFSQLIFLSVAKIVYVCGCCGAVGHGDAIFTIFPKFWCILIGQIFLF